MSSLFNCYCEHDFCVGTPAAADLEAANPAAISCSFADICAEAKVMEL